MTKIKISYQGNYKTECVHVESGVRISTTPPKDVDPHGGIAFSPTDLLAASLGSCMMTLMSMAAKKIAFDLTGCEAEVTKEMAASSPRRIGRLIVRISCPQIPSEPIRLKLEKAALECPVVLSLHPDIKKETDFIWGV